MATACMLLAEINQFLQGASLLLLLECCNNTKQPHTRRLLKVKLRFSSKLHTSKQCNNNRQCSS
eukprot:10363359-Ditylum_brightwellii.AAC.1